MLPAPPPPAPLLLQQETGDRDSGYGPLSLPWLIVIVVWAVLTPCLILLILLHMRRAEVWCFSPKTEAPAPVQDLGYGGTLFVEQEVARV